MSDSRYLIIYKITHDCINALFLKLTIDIEDFYVEIMVLLKRFLQIVALNNILYSYRTDSRDFRRKI